MNGDMSSFLFLFLNSHHSISEKRKFIIKLSSL